VELKYSIRGQKNYHDLPPPTGMDEADADEFAKECITDICEEAADHFHDHLDGWESQWPIVFEIFMDGVSMGKCEVEREYEPAFSASQIANKGE